MLDVVRAHQAQRTGVHRKIDRRIADAPGRELMEEFVPSIQSGRAWHVSAGQVWRIVA